MIMLGAVAFLTGGCEQRPDQWDAHIYNSSDDGSIQEYSIKGFKTFELCQAAAQSELLRHGRHESADYECGYRCGPDADYGGLNVCKETRK